MSLSFEAKLLPGAEGSGGGEEGSIERYRTELVLAGGVDITRVRTAPCYKYVKWIQFCPEI